MKRVAFRKAFDLGQSRIEKLIAKREKEIEDTLDALCLTVSGGYLKLLKVTPDTYPGEYLVQAYEVKLDPDSKKRVLGSYHNLAKVQCAEEVFPCTVSWSSVAFMCDNTKDLTKALDQMLLAPRPAYLLYKIRTRVIR